MAEGEVKVEEREHRWCEVGDNGAESLEWGGILKSGVEEGRWGVTTNNQTLPKGTWIPITGEAARNIYRYRYKQSSNAIT